MNRLQAVVSATNGVFGDFLARSGNGLATTFGFRDRQGCLLSLTRAALAAELPDASGDIAVFLHGLCCDEHIWSTYADENGGDTYASKLQREHRYTPVFLRYNSGRHISENGEDFAAALETLLANWPVKVRRVALIGHSMGGLIARSAAHQALEQGLQWPEKITHLVCLGSPHHGAPLERFGHLATSLLGMLDITRPLATAINARSAGIKDLRHGSLRHDDWRDHDQDLIGHDTRLPVLRLPKTRLHFIGAMLGDGPLHPRTRWIGDGLVLHDSASGHHLNETLKVPFIDGDGLMLPSLHHLRLVNHPDVYTQLSRWLA